MQLLLSIAMVSAAVAALWALLWRPAFSGGGAWRIRGSIRAPGEFDSSGFEVYLASMDTSAGEVVISRVHDSRGGPIETVTGKGGVFELTGVPDGVYWVAFKKKGYNTRMRLVKVAGADAEAVLVFK